MKFTKVVKAEDQDFYKNIIKSQINYSKKIKSDMEQIIKNNLTLLNDLKFNQNNPNNALKYIEIEKEERYLAGLKEIYNQLQTIFRM